MANGDPDAFIERRELSRTRSAAVERSLDIARWLREREGWRTSSASVAQSWNLCVRGRRHPIRSYNTAFLDDGPRAPCFVFSIAIAARVRSMPWFESLQRRLGPSYSTDDVERSGNISLTRVIRRTSEPSVMLHELRHISAAIEGGRMPRTRPEPRPQAKKRSRGPHEDMWTILDALEGASWRAHDVASRQDREVRYAGFRWHLGATMSLIVDSAVGRPGFAGLIGASSRRRNAVNPITKTAKLLEETEHRLLGDDYYQRWHGGLGRRAAEREVVILEQALDLLSK